MMSLEEQFVVEQAKGVLSEREGITIAAAAEALVVEARDSGRPLIDVVCEVLDSVSGAYGRTLR